MSAVHNTESKKRPADVCLFAQAGHATLKTNAIGIGVECSITWIGKYVNQNSTSYESPACLSFLIQKERSGGFPIT
jgi:hypothetical protein